MIAHKYSLKMTMEVESANAVENKFFIMESHLVIYILLLTFLIKHILIINLIFIIIIKHKYFLNISDFL